MDQYAICTGDPRAVQSAVYLKPDSWLETSGSTARTRVSADAIRVHILARKCRQ